MSERQLLPAVEKRAAWRPCNGLTQEQAFRPLHRHGFPIVLTTFQKGGMGERKPTQIAQIALDAFLEKHPTANPPTSDA